jgi:hypothetical protein
VRFSIALRRVRDRIEKQWCSGSSAKTHSGEACFPRDSQACYWCAVGAIYKLSNPALRYRMRGVMEKLAQAQHQKSLAEVNDQLGQAAVLALYDLAIQQQQTHESKVRR